MNIGYKLVKNNMPATAEKAPYLGMAIPVGSLAYDNILREMIDGGTKMSLATARYFLEAFYDYAAKKIAAEAVRINTGTVAIYPMIDGSFDSEDAPFDPKRNSLYVGATLSQELRDRVAGIAPDFAGDVSLGTVKLHSCMDLETEVFKVIRGTEDFCLAGANVTVPDGADESLGLYAKNGVDKVADIVVSETDGGQRITCHLSDAAEVPVGTYKVRLASHGLDPTDPLTVATLTVTLVEAIPAGPAPIATNSDGTVKCMSVADPASAELPELDDEWTVAFEGLADNAKWRYDSTAFKVGGETKGCTATCDGDTLAFLGTEGVGPTGDYDGVITVKLVDREDAGKTDKVDIPVRFHANEH